MMKLTKLALALDMAQIEKGHKLIDSLYKKVQAYNKEIEKSNKLLREQERLRKTLGVSVQKGKVSGLPTEK